MTVRLSGLAVENWKTLDGYAVGAGFDLLELPLARFTNFIWWFFTRNAEPNAIEKFRAKLWQPPKPGVEIDPRSPWAPENELKAFAQLKSQLMPGAPAKST